MEKIEASGESSNSGVADNYLGNEIKCMISAYRRLEESKPHHYLLTLIKIEKRRMRFVSTPKFMEAYYGVLNKEGESIKDVILRDKNAVNQYRRDLEEVISKELKK